MGTHLIIILATFTVDGCLRNVFGVGYAESKLEAIHNAIAHLKSRDSDYDEERDGFTIDAEKIY
ncbi:hypothetical protein [Neptunitalea lumnitzerae]|uniref:Uncharacterized protein n=1 Tax=Neptunitalea lumnitzerae TaxID=2965509 RepID=A0ABQ5ME96_9FLAO|nr:hypothetical protein [Neptunitalea sp. Y10]GLB47704.1 hypothetical protein Y10_00720 [Neptunitalea sp. Y10]